MFFERYIGIGIAHILRRRMHITRMGQSTLPHHSQIRKPEMIDSVVLKYLYFLVWGETVEGVRPKIR